MKKSLNPLYIGFSPKKQKSNEYAKILGEETKKLRQTGELRKILQKYGVPDWEN